MRNVIAVILGLAVFCGIMILGNIFIHWITSGIPFPWNKIIDIILWLILIYPIGGLSVIAGLLVYAIVITIGTNQGYKNRLKALKTNKYGKQN